MDGLKPAIDALTGFGTAAPAIGLLLWLFWQERTERRELAAENRKQLAEAIEAEKDMTQALTLLAGKLGK